MRAVSIRTPAYAPGVRKKIELKPRSYFINERYIAVIWDLIERVMMVDSSPGYASSARDYAFDTYRNAAAAYRIAKRGLDNSANRKARASRGPIFFQ